MSIQEQRKPLTITSLKYIPSPEHWKEMYRKYHFYEVKERVAIDEIKINRSLFEFNNRVSASAVEYMCNNFEEEAWEPITVSEKMFLLDGQHRFECAKNKKWQRYDTI